MNQSKIKNIIFDLGNVIINVDSVLTAQAMKELGFKDFEKSYTLFKQTDLFDRLEKGEITPDHLRNELRKHLVNPALPACSSDMPACRLVTDEEFDKAWGAMLLDFPKERIDLIRKLGEKYNIYLLSNTNEIHYHQYIEDFKDEYGFDFNSLFVKPYYSHQVGYRKPDSKIYEHVIADSNLIPEESVFIDDLKVNIDTAKKTGLQTIWLDLEKGDDILTKLNGF